MAFNIIISILVCVLGLVQYFIIMECLSLLKVIRSVQMDTQAKLNTLNYRLDGEHERTTKVWSKLDQLNLLDYDDEKV